MLEDTKLVQGAVKVIDYDPNAFYIHWPSHDTSIYDYESVYSPSMGVTNSHLFFKQNVNKKICFHPSYNNRSAEFSVGITSRNFSVPHVFDFTGVTFIKNQSLLNHPPAISLTAYHAPSLTWVMNKIENLNIDIEITFSGYNPTSATYVSPISGDSINNSYVKIKFLENIPNVQTKLMMLDIIQIYNINNSYIYGELYCPTNALFRDMFTSSGVSSVTNSTIVAIRSSKFSWGEGGTMPPNPLTGAIKGGYSTKLTNTKLYVSGLESSSTWISQGNQTRCILSWCNASTDSFGNTGTLNVEQGTHGTSAHVDCETTSNLLSLNGTTITRTIGQPNPPLTN
jgi:hypothetical protein